MFINNFQFSGQLKKGKLQYDRHVTNEIIIIGESFQRNQTEYERIKTILYIYKI